MVEGVPWVAGAGAGVVTVLWDLVQVPFPQCEATKVTIDAPGRVKWWSFERVGVV